MTDIKEPINITSDGTFLSVACENPKKVLLAKSWGAVAPPSPPRNYPPAVHTKLVGFFLLIRNIGNVNKMFKVLKLANFAISRKSEY